MESQGSNNNSRSEALRSIEWDLIVIHSLAADRDRTLTEYAATVPSTSIVDRKRSSGRFNSLRNNSVGSLTSTTTPGSSHSAKTSAFERLLSIIPKAVAYGFFHACGSVRGNFHSIRLTAGSFLLGHIRRGRNVVDPSSSFIESFRCSCSLDLWGYCTWK